LEAQIKANWTSRERERGGKNKIPVNLSLVKTIDKRPEHPI